MKKYLVVYMAAVAVMFSLMLSMERMFQRRLQETTETIADVEVEALKENPEIFALFGVDAEEGELGRSDCIMLVSYEEENCVLKMCSIARDTLVTIPGTEEPTKLAHAYAMGGAEKALETINGNFGLDVTHYATVNFTQMAELVDVLGGVSVTLTEAEWEALGFEVPYLGKKRLDGGEALAYCRIRSIDNDDARTARQRKVLKAMFSKVKTVPKTDLPKVIMDGIKMCSTNVGFYKLLRLGKSALSARGGLETKSLSLPGDSVDVWGGVREDGVWYYVYDLTAASRVIREFFGGEMIAETM